MKLVPPEGDVSETAGGVLALTVTVTEPELVAAPALSVATAFSEYDPAPTLFQEKEYGLLESVPSSVVPL
jgi:hypothetical protein